MFDRYVMAGFLDGLQYESEKRALDECATALMLTYVGEETLKCASLEDLEAIKEAFLGALAKKGLATARTGIRQGTGRVAPRLNMPVGTAVRDAANTMQKSRSNFVSGVGDTLKHKMHSRGTATIAALNPVGTAAEAVTAGAGKATAAGLASTGKRMATRHAGDADTLMARSWTPAGRMRNRKLRFGTALNQTASPGGAVHKGLTQTAPRVAEIAGPVAAGSLLHAPMGAAALAGKGTTGALGALGAGAQVKGMVGGLMSALPSGSMGVAQHALEDVAGTAKLEKARRLLAARSRVA